MTGKAVSLDSPDNDISRILVGKTLKTHGHM